MLQVLFGSLSLQLAEAEPDSPKTAGTLAAAHRVLSQALACQGQTSRQDGAVICMLLARVELLGNLRRKQERAQVHAMKVSYARVYTLSAYSASAVQRTGFCRLLWYVRVPYVHPCFCM